MGWNGIKMNKNKVKHETNEYNKVKLKVKIWNKVKI